MRLSLSGLIDRWLAPAPPPAQVAWLRGQTFAHRGLHDGGLHGGGPHGSGPHGTAVPENAPSAFAAAIARGLGIECDVQLTADGQAMVFHDFTLERLTGEHGAVIDQTAAHLATIPLRGSADCIPSLAELLRLVAGQVALLIEVKMRGNRSVAPLCRAVLAALAGYSGPHAVMSFDPRVSRWFARHAPHLTRGLIVTEEADKGLLGRLRRHVSLWFARPHFLAYDIRDLPSRFASAQRQRGLPVASWTVRSPDLMARAALHADAPIAEGAGIA